MMIAQMVKIQKINILMKIAQMIKVQKINILMKIVQMIEMQKIIKPRKNYTKDKYTKENQKPKEKTKRITKQLVVY